MAFIEPCFGIGHNLSLICQMTSEDIKHQLIAIFSGRLPEGAELTEGSGALWSGLFPTASLGIAEDFHILHSAYVYICYSILKAKTYNWLLTHTHTHTHTHSHTHTHTHTRTHMTINNYKQKATGHVTSLANGHVTGSDAHFECEIPTASSNIKIYNFANFGLAMGTPAGFAPTKECFKRSRWFGKRHKTGGTYCQSCLYPTISP